MEILKITFKEQGNYPWSSWSKYHSLNELVNDKLVNCCSYGIFKYTDIFATKMWVAFAMQKLINVFAIFQDRNFNVNLANNFVKFWTTGPRILFLSGAMHNFLTSSHF